MRGLYFEITSFIRMKTKFRFYIELRHSWLVSVAVSVTKDPHGKY